MGEPDAALRRIERDAWICCAAAALAALAIQRGRPDGLLAVLAGGALIGGSYRAIKTAAAALGGGGAGGPRRGRVALLAGAAVAGQFLLILAAYVMIARLRLHPIGLLVGASSLVAGVALEALRTATRFRGP